MLQAWIIILGTHVGILNADRGAFDYHSISCPHNRIIHWDVLDLSVWTQVLVCVLFFSQKQEWTQKNVESGSTRTCQIFLTRPWIDDATTTKRNGDLLLKIRNRSRDTEMLLLELGKLMGECQFYDGL